ncbi:MAG: hypothetical protein AAF327_17745, partial [Cyanobacteria bacterium P01_A01_bin.37]
MANIDATGCEWNEQIQALVDGGKYRDAEKRYELAIQSDPEGRSSYWYLGLIKLLQGDEPSAQTTWFIPLSACDSEDLMEQLSQELLFILDDEAARQQTNDNSETVWVIRQHIRELDPTNFNNLLLLIQTAIRTERFHVEDLEAWEMLTFLRDNMFSTPHSVLLADTLLELIKNYAFDPLIYDIVEICTSFFKQEPNLFVEGLVNESGRIAFGEGNPGLAAHFLELGHQLTPNNLEVLRFLSVFYQNARQLEKALTLAY